MRAAVEGRMRAGPSAAGFSYRVSITKSGPVFLPWVLPGIFVSRVFAGQGRWTRAPGGRRWSPLATVERRRTAQGRPCFGALG